MVYPKVIERRIQEELPFMATENIIMAIVTKNSKPAADDESVSPLIFDETKAHADGWDSRRTSLWRSTRGT